MPNVRSIPKQLQNIFETVRHIKKMKQGSYLFYEDSIPNEVYIVLSGKIIITKMTPDGRELTLRICSRDDIVGELILFAPSPKYMVDAKVMEDSEVAVIVKEDIEKSLALNNEAAIEYIKWMSLHHRKNQTKFRDLVLHGKRGALFSTLIRLCNSYGKYTNNGTMISISLTNQELANFCGTSREVVNRILSDLRKMKVISTDKGIITIHNLDYLKRSIDCENCPLEFCNIE